MRFAMNNEFKHTTVLMHETIQNILPKQNLIDALKKKREKYLFIVDATLGGAGHTKHLIECIAKEEIYKNFELNLIAFDQDLSALNFAEQVLLNLQKKYKWLHFHLINKNFKYLQNEMFAKFPGQKIHGLYADFGVSSPQLDIGERGFSLINDGPIDMRMDTKNAFTARNILEEYSEENLIRMFFEYGEEPKSRKLAKAIIQDRKIKKLPLNSTIELADYIKRVLAYPNSRIHPATRAFQALRIEVNNELESINELLQNLPQLMHLFSKSGFISFHSLEDRIIKHAMRNWQKGKNAKEKQTNKKEFQIPLHLQFHLEENQINGFGKEIPRGGITASQEECRMNIRSRSARLRCFEFSNETGS
jgi:16S rRNA (cytosine1402-N4)-methyltransferase